MIALHKYYWSSPNGYYGINCTKCPAEMNGFDTEAEAIAAWNARVTDVEVQHSQEVSKMQEKIWSCKIGKCDSQKIFHPAANCIMREAVANAYKAVTGESPQFLFAGWGAELDESERAAIEDRSPSAEHYKKWCLEQIADELLEVVKEMTVVLDPSTPEMPLLCAQLVERGRSLISKANGGTCK